MRQTSKILLLLILVAAIIPYTQVKAQARPSIEMVVTPVFEGMFKYGEWLPLSIELTNDGQDMEAEVRVRVPRASGGLTFTQPVSLPAGAHKLVTLFILPNNYSHSLDVELVSQGEVVAAGKAALKPMMNVNVIIGLAAQERGALSLLGGLQYPNNQRPVQLVDVNLWQLPEQIEGLRSFDVLVFNNIDTSKLTPGQASGLAAWVQNGGRLVLGGGTGADKTLAGIPADLLPVKLNGRSALKAEDLHSLADFSGGQAVQSAGEFPVSQAVDAGGMALASTADGQVLVSERAIGQGWVDFIALDVSQAPFEGWSGSQRFWEKLFRTSEDFFDQPTDISPRSMRASMMSSPLTMIPSMELPSVKWLALILGLYILIVGPVNYLVLKRKKRLHWAWFTIPGITILFSGAAFGGAYLLKGNDLLIHKIGVLEIQPGGSALATSYMGLFSPSQKAYEVEIPSGSLLSPIMDEYVPYNMSGPGAELTIQQGKPSLLKGLAVNQWSMQSFMTEETIPEFGRVSGELVLKDGLLTGKIRNGLKTPLNDASLILRNQYLRLGDLQPGQEVEVKFDPTPNLAMRGMPAYYKMYEDQYAEASASERALIDLKRSILSPLFDNQMLLKLSSSLPVGGGGGGVEGGTPSSSHTVLLTGWVDQLPPEVRVAGETATVQTLGLTYDHIPYKLSLEGNVDFPPGLLVGRVLESNAGMCGPADTMSFYFDRGMQATVEYSLTDPQTLNYNQINLYLESDIIQGNDLPKVALYDWQSEEWINFPDAAVGINIIETPARFIGENGKVRIQFTKETQTQMGGCVYIEMGFQGAGKGDVQ